MAAIEISKKLFQSFLKKKLSDEALAERLPMLGADVEQITADTIVVDILPNRPDFLSEAGLARALNTLLGEKPREYSAEKSTYTAFVDAGVAGVRPYAACAVVKGIRFDEENIVAIMRFQEKLHSTFCRRRGNAAVGVHDLDVISFPVKYTTVTADFKFTPLDADREMSVHEILARHPKGVAFAHLLPGPSYPVWLDAVGEVIALPPVINAARTALSHNTTDVFIDVTGLNENTVNKTLNIVVCALADAGGTAYQVRVGKKTTPDLKPGQMSISPEYVNKLLGLDLSKTAIEACLQRMGFRTMAGKALIPAYRTDVMHACDLAEEAAIAYGYGKIQAVLPNISTIGNEARENTIVRKAAEVLAGLGFLEVVTYTLSNEEVLLKKTSLAEKVVKTTNSVNANYDTLRNRLAPGLLKVLSENKHYEYPQKIFEIGLVILPASVPRQELRAAAASCHAQAGFTEIKSTAEAFFKSLGKAAAFRPVESPLFIRGRAAEIITDGKIIGVAGEISPRVLENFGLESPAAVFEAKLVPAEHE